MFWKINVHAWARLCFFFFFYYYYYYCCYYCYYYYYYYYFFFFYYYYCCCYYYHFFFFFFFNSFIVVECLIFVFVDIEETISASYFLSPNEHNQRVKQSCLYFHTKCYAHLI